MSSKTSKNRNARARLELLELPAGPARTAYVPSRRLPRRPGERREPLAIRLPSALAAAAAERGLDAVCAAELCLERALVVADLTVLARPELYERLLAVAGTVTVRLPLPAAKARYLRMLLAARDRRAGAIHVTDGAKDIVTDIPLRLFPRVATVVDGMTSTGCEELAESMTLEIAAVSEGRTMSEWAAIAALRLSL